MTWQFTSEVSISILAAIIAVAIGLLSWRWWKTPGIVYFSLFEFSIGGWAIFLGLEAAVTSMPEQILFAKMQFMMIGLIPAFWLIFMLHFTHPNQKLAPWWVIVLLLFPIASIIITVFEDTGYWLWARLLPVTSNPGTSSTYSHGWWYQFAISYYILLALVGIGILVLRTMRLPQNRAIRALILLLGVLPPLTCNLLYKLGVNPQINLNLYLLIGMVISGLIYYWEIFYYQIQESASLSRDVIIDRMSEGVIVLDKRDRIFNINSTALSMLGLNEQTAKGKTLNDITNIWPGVAESFRVSHDFETEVKINGDEPRMLTMRTTNLKDKDGQSTGRMIVWRDITQYRQVETTLRDSEARFKALFQGAPDAIIITDKNSRIVLVNNQTITLFGYAIEELVGSPIDVVIPERYREAYYKYQKAFFDEIETRPGISLPINGARKNKREIPIEIALSPVKTPSGVIFTNIIRDLTIRKEAEEQLRLQSVALESAANGIMITDRNGNIQWVNPAYTKMTGYTAADVHGKNPRLQKSGLVAQDVYQNLWKTILSGNIWHGELINRRKDGSIVTEEQTIAPVRDSSGQIIHFIAIKQDITERKRAEDALSKRTSQIATLNRVMQTLTSTLDLTKVLDTILREIQQVVQYDSASVWLCKDDSMEIIAVRGFHNPQELVGTTFALASEDNPNSEVVRTRKPMLVGDAYETYSSFRSGVHAQYRHRGWMGIPMIIGDRVIGMLAFDKKVPDFYTEEQSRYALAFAAQAAIAIENARLYSDAQKELTEKIIAEEKLLALQKELEEQAIRDSLTGLYNRRFLDETLSRELSRAERDKYSVSVVLMDLDNFKLFNDTYGHDVGDLMLKQLGKLLTNQVRAGDIACRYGGEEFVVVMPKASLSVARQRANDWRNRFESQILIHKGEVLNATLSAGVAVYPLHGASGEEIIRKADQAMYAAKGAGRNLVITAE